MLKKALDRSKDQSYVLYMLTQEQLERIRFPLGGLRKSEVREIAERQGFCNARKHDSQDICFVPDGDHGRFLARFRGRELPKGKILNARGEVVGTHKGAAQYTVGQRKGLGVALGEPVYVLRKDVRENTVTVGPEEALYSRTLHADEVNWLSIHAPEGPLRVRAKTRYRQEEREATVFPCEETRFRLEFDEPQRAVTPGQAVVLYDGDLVLGGGTITDVER